MNVKKWAAGLAAGAALMGAGSAFAGPNIIVNGDFSAGNTGFTSGYTYVAPNDYNLGDKSGYSGEGKYTIASNPALQNRFFVAMNDNNPRLLVNGATAGAPIVFRTDTTLGYTGTYNFSADVADICCNSTFAGNPDNPSQIFFQYSLNGGAFQTLASLTTGSVPAGTFTTLAASFMANFGDTFVLRVTNGTNALSGNDFAIDNVSVAAAVPEPATWAFMILGVAMAGFALRRRQQGAQFA